jgi:hypothetical protein
MASRKEHCKETLEKLGQEWDEVHAWLDGLACVSGQLNINHRRWRHHDEGIEVIREMYGDVAAEAAKIHIIRDFGRIPTKAEVEAAFPEEPELMSFDLLTSKGQKNQRRNKDPRKYD